VKPIIFLFSALIVLLLSPGTTIGQQINVDSLKNELPLAKGKERLLILNELGTSLREVSPTQALDYSLEAEKIAKELGDKSAEAKAKENIGWVYYRQGQWQKTFDYSKDAYDLAIEVNDFQEAARVLNSMGALYYEQNNFLMAIEQFKKAYEISVKGDDLYTQLRSLNNVAFNYSQLGELDSAVYYAEKSIQLNFQAGSPYLTGFATRVIGDVYFKRKQLDSAEVVFERALQMAKIQGVKSFEASVLHRLGQTYLLQGKIQEAKSILEEGVKLSKENSFLDELSKSHKFLAQVYDRQGNIPLAYKHQTIYLELYDSLVNKSNQDKMALLQGMFQDNLAQSELKLLKAQNENQANRLNFSRNLNLVIGFAGILISGLVIWLFFLNRNVKKTNSDLILQQQKINDQNIDLEHKSKQLEEINRTKNKLFSILGHDMRGPVGQVKSIVDMALAGHLNQKEFNELLKALKKDVDSVYLTLNNTLNWSMSQMEGFKLKQVSLNLTEVVDSSLQLLHTQFSEKSLEVENLMPPKVQVFADADLIEVVVRNILNNAVKFSEKGNTIKITSDLTQNQIKWCVVDQGIGMSAEKINKILEEDYVITGSQRGTNQEKGSGLGLQVCKEFVRMHGGQLLIESQPGIGSTVCMKIPTGDLKDLQMTQTEKSVKA
jgi:signal transduction histidine kinase/Tfp pilus assembly protein PilF